MIVDRERREAELFCGFGVSREGPECRWPSAEIYKGQVYPVIYATPSISLNRPVAFVMAGSFE